MKNTLKEGTVVSGFQIKKITELEEYQSIGISCQHLKTGCLLYHIYNDDQENAFAYVFRTPPKNSTGVSHILEHSVLCGSRNFPLKDPFVILLQSSLHTYLNAWTYPDKTVYPAASINAKDYFNLLLVYGDAVFFPLLRKEIFLQEAYHYELLDSAEGTQIKLVPSGVVFNEMKGNYSSQNSIVAEYTLRSLFPDTPYGFDSGGEPQEILDLTYEDFLAFHRHYYHPSNCRILLYGNIPTVEQLTFLEKNFLSHFEALSLNSSIPFQTRKTNPIYIEKTCPLAEGQSAQDKAEITFSWLIGPSSDTKLRFAFFLINEILAGHAGSPLRKALVESGLGQDYSSAAGLETELKEMVFTTGLRGTNPEAATKIEELIFKTLKDLVAKGIPLKALEASLNRLEFQCREISGNGIPWGLKLFQRSLAGFLHDEHPEETLLVLKRLEKIKQELKKEKRLLEKLIEGYLLKNSHRSMVIVKPDPNFQADFEKQIQKKVSQNTQQLDPEKIKEELKTLIEFQSSEPVLEDINKLPYLKRADLPSKITQLEPNEIKLEPNLKIFLCPAFTNSLIYFDFAFDLSNLLKSQPHLIKLIPLLGEAITGCGLPGYSYAVIQEKLALLTGGFFSICETASEQLTHQAKPYLFFRLKCLAPKAPAALELALSLFQKADFKDLKRLRDLVNEKRNRLASSLIPRGSYHALLRAGRSFSKALAIQEEWESISQLEFLNNEIANLSCASSNLPASLELLRSFLLTDTQLSLGLTSSEDDFKTLKPLLANLKVTFNFKSLDSNFKNTQKDTIYPLAEAILAPTSVNFTAQCLKGAAFGTIEYAAESVLGNLLETGLLHEAVRTKGGAYGAMAFPLRQEQIFAFASYRDPNLNATFKNYQTVLERASQFNFTDEQIRRALIGTIAKDEIPLRPNERGFIALRRRLFGLSDELRQKHRDNLFCLSSKQITQAANRLLKAFISSSSAFMTNEERLKEFKAQNQNFKFSETKTTF